jgi:glycerophosphoryl diester phosphodiesterase
VGFLDFDGVIAMAHRGYATAGDENSMAAFQRAIDLGYRYLETDVRVTADGVALAFHDAHLDRLTDGRGPVAAQPYAALRRLRIGGEPIALLADVLGTWPDARVNIDVKSHAAIASTVDVITRTRSVERVCVGSFADHRLARLRRALGPRVCTSLGPAEAVALRLRSRAPAVRTGRPFSNRCAQLPARLGSVGVIDERLVRTAHRAGLPVHAWTVNDPAEMHRLLDLGVDGIITDRCAALREVLVERGQWRS